jgi:sugar phosphate isomerase/epimerase
VKLGLDSYSYHLAFGAHPDFRPNQPMTLFDFMERVAELGLDGFQIDPMHLSEKSEAYLQDVADFARERNLFIEYGTIGVEPRNIVEEIRACQILGSPILRTFLGFDRFDKNTDVSCELDRAEKQLRQVLPDLAEAKITLAIENHGDVTSGELVGLIERLENPHVGICLDVGNPLAVLEDPVFAADKMAPFAVTTHFKDYALEMTNYGFKVKGCVIGEGVIDLDRIFDIIVERSKLDRLILEIPVEKEANEADSLKKEEEIIKRSVNFVREKWLI